MIKVIGAVAEIVPLPDIDDRVYYKQEKVFSDHQYSKSHDLKREIQKGRLIVVQETNEKSANFHLPEVDTKVDDRVIVSHVENLEKHIDNANSNPDLINSLVSKIDSLEKKISSMESVDSNDAILSAFKRLEEKIEDARVDKEMFKKIEDAIKNVQVTSRTVDPVYGKPVDSTKVDQEIYVPKVNVKDGNSNINLKIRTVEKSGGIDSAAEALRKLKQSKK